MPKRKRVQREHTEDWQTIQQYTFWPEQTAYELLRPVVLFGDPAIQRVWHAFGDSGCLLFVSDRSFYINKRIFVEGSYERWK